MPIKTYNRANFEEIEWLCEGIWDMPDQIYSLETWLKTKGIQLPKSSYVANIGFNIRKDATGGGAVINAESMKIMGEIGMDIYLSEYPS